MVHYVITKLSNSWHCEIVDFNLSTLRWKVKYIDRIVEIFFLNHGVKK